MSAVLTAITAPNEKDRQEAACARFLHELNNVAMVHGADRDDTARVLHGFSKRLIGMLTAHYSKEELQDLCGALMENAGFRTLVA